MTDSPENPLGDLPPPRAGSRRSRRRRSSGPGFPLVAMVVAVLALGGLAWWWFGYRDSGEDPVPTTAASDTVPADTVPGDTLPLEPIDLPPLEESDGPIRTLAERLSAHPGWARWLVTDRLVERFAATVASVAAESSPRSQLPFMDPDGEFTARESGDRLVIDPASFRRYDRVSDVFTSLDTRGTVRLYRQLHPLFDEAYQELGFPPGSFDADLARAMDLVLAVEVPEGEIEVVEGVESYEYADPALEARSPAEKHVLRLGPRNAERVQRKVRELRDALVAAGVLPRGG